MANEEVYPLVYSHIHVMIVAAPHFEVRAEHHYLYPIPRIVFKLLQYTSTWLTSPVNSVKLMLTLLLSLASKPKKASLAKKAELETKRRTVTVIDVASVGTWLEIVSQVDYRKS